MKSVAPAVNCQWKMLSLFSPIGRSLTAVLLLPLYSLSLSPPFIPKLISIINLNIEITLGDERENKGGNDDDVGEQQE